MRPILSDNRLPGWRNRFARARQVGESLNFASPDSGKGREEENNRTCDMPLQADSVFFVSPRSLFLLLVPLPLCSLSVFVRLISPETLVPMGTNRTRAFARNLKTICCLDTPTIWVTWKWSFHRSMSIFTLSRTLVFLLSFWDTVSAYTYLKLLNKRETRVNDDEDVVSSSCGVTFGQGHEVSEPLGNRIE